MEGPPGGAACAAAAAATLQAPAAFLNDETARDQVPPIACRPTSLGRCDRCRGPGPYVSRVFPRALQFEPTTCLPSRRTAGAPSDPRTNHRSDAEATGDTVRVGTICRVAAT